MNNNHLTTRNFWLHYWESKQGLVFSIPANYPFTQEISELVRLNHCQNLLEIGGFPGYYCIWAKKYLQINTSLLDFVIHPNILANLLQANGLNNNEVASIEADLFDENNKVEPLYDFVISNGLIEHFTDTSQILEKHLAYLATGGILYVSLPNFRGLNGWFQRVFDEENYKKHHIPCMDLGFLEQTAQNLQLQNISVRYDGRFMLWFENEWEKPLWVRIFKKAVWLPLKIFFKIISLETRWFSPYIVLVAKKL